MIRTINNRNLRIISNGNLLNVGAPTQSKIFTTSINNSYISNGFGTPDFAKLVPDVITFRSSFTKTGTASGVTFRLYWNTSLSTSGATQLATFQITNTITHVNFHRRIFFTNSNTARLMNTTYDSTTDIGDYNTTLSTVTISNWTTQEGYFFFACDAVSPFATDTLSQIYFSAEI